jgi:hypothetical protein
MKDPITLCLAYDMRSSGTTCPRAAQCQRHQLLSHDDKQDDAPILGTACASMDYVLFLPVEPAHAE